jgi:hypothetical protein
VPRVVPGDPVDARLLAHVAQAGRIAVHEIAAAVGMDARDVAARLVALSATGLPLLVGVECDQSALRAALNSGQWGSAQWSSTQGSSTQGSSTRPPTGGHPVPAPPGPYPHHPPYPAAGPPSGSHPAQPPPSAGFARPPVHGPPSGRPPAPPRPAPPAPIAGDDEETEQDLISTWGPPQTSSWARGDQPPQPPPRQARRPAGPRRGGVGDKLHGDGPDGEQVDIKLVEVVDPADYLFGAAGYRLAHGERAIVVHTELTNASATPYPTLPDLHLVLVTSEGATVGKAPVSLSSRPPHRLGVQPGETAGGHAVFVVPERMAITEVMWSARADGHGALSWRLGT